MRVLIIEDDAAIRDNLAELLEAEGHQPMQAANGKVGLSLALSDAPDLIICDITMPVMDGHDVLRGIRDYPQTAAIPFVFLTARAQRADVREGMRLGADDYLTKPFTRDEILEVVATRLGRRQPHRPPAPVGPQDSPDGPLVLSEALETVYGQARRGAATDLSMLLLGETGVGKDVLAHEVHRASPRAGKPFIPLNCAALATNLLESELFGHERGAFTGANEGKPGLFEAADGGTVFLDEVGEIPLQTQVKLLRVLEDRKVMRVGARVAKPIDVRFVAATNRDLEAGVERGSFRQDLYFRIAGITLVVPPLRDRLVEVMPLAERFANRLATHLGRPVPTFDAETQALLQAHVWSGNVRELKNVVEQAVALCPGSTITPAELPARMLGGGPRVEGGDIGQKIRSLEKQRIVEALEANGGNQTRAARTLGISRRTLVNRLDQFGLPRPRKS